MKSRPTHTRRLMAGDRVLAPWGQRGTVTQIHGPEQIVVVRWDGALEPEPIDRRSVRLGLQGRPRTAEAVRLGLQGRPRIAAWG